MILQATHTHLYSGHRGKISGLSQIADLQRGGDCLVEFSDGSAAPARISKNDDAWQLDTNAYRTGAGTEITKKRWRLDLEEDGRQVIFRILEKIPDS